MCISSSSCASLIIRQPAVTGVALTIFIAGAAPAMLSAKTNLDGLLDADAAGSDAALLQPVRDALERAFVLLPDRDVGVLDRAAGELFARAIFFERRA